ncbi:lytic murein transglycosylase B [Halovibrio salipaludis]|uniref:Lytic murein transglycosylase B n=1 Tax=Halovibrio salipaludis TaxID=2032626 RepID=A0A2A2F5F7_9GAMM|nr:lytic murein transglycosylase B [Halovibrio salipaludis]PAU79907.1 lytic murein transglycosylase B [Halovibrio salipaludis]
MSRFPIALLIALVSLSVVAATSDRERFIERMAREEGFERKQVKAWLEAARHDETVIERISAPAEKVLEWGEYRGIFLTPERVEQGRAFMARHEKALGRAEARYGVPAELVTAIIGIETFYGRHAGNDRVLDALVTLGFGYPPRADFFRDELHHYLVLARDQGFDPREPMGSYAGAMGYGQFIASSYRHYAVDFDGDGAVDLFDSPVDAIGSVANYFHEHDWHAGAPVAMPLDEWRGPVGGTRLLRLTVEDRPQHWVAHANFDVITRYNHSDLYAMAAWSLAQDLKEASGDE